MAAPPFVLGAVNAMLAVVLPAVALPIVGAPGAVTALKTPCDSPASAKKKMPRKTCLKPETWIFTTLSHSWKAKLLKARNASSENYENFKKTKFNHYKMVTR